MSLFVENPIFITGMYRSGTTYLSRIIGAHSELDITYDSVNYFRFIVKNNIDPSEYVEIVNHTSERLLKRHGIALDNENIIDQIRSFEANITHKVIYSAIMYEFFNSSDKRWGEKTLLEWSNVPTFLSMFSQGKCIHVLRDPRDVLASYKNMTFEKGENYLDAIFASLHSFNTSIKYKTILPQNRYLIVIYEDLIKDTKKITQNICEFLEIKFEKAMLDPKNYRSLDGKSFDFKTHTSFPTENVKPLDRWKTKLSDYEIQFTEAIIGSQMNKFGYELSTNIDNNYITRLIDIIFKNPLLKERIINLIQTGDGVESYPSDPTDPDNWGSDTGVRGEGAYKAYAK